MSVCSIVLAGSIIISPNAFAQTQDNSFDLVEKAESQGYVAEEKGLQGFIQDKADKEGKSYDYVAEDLYEKVEKIHQKYSTKPLYNDLSTSMSVNSSTTPANAVPLSSVISSYAIANYDHLVKNTEEVVSGDLNIEYGVDTVIYSSGSFREFVEVHEDTAFVIPSGTGTHDWSPAYERAELDSPTVVSFRAYGNLESTVSQSVSAGFELAGFSVASETGTTVTLRKSHQIVHEFSLY